MLKIIQRKYTEKKNDLEWNKKDDYDHVQCKIQEITDKYDFHSG